MNKIIILTLSFNKQDMSYELDCSGSEYRRLVGSNIGIDFCGSIKRKTNFLTKLPAISF